ncbi:rhombosortase [Pontibacterium granulatum]|uniref:rhombosortase n=1 Tax=Pontibacterium granulatum TaxID=2036029 RepID=UPI00249A8BAE|nr:rhombosortase [Pontibacterium granulatum]MDI3325039.1 rhombosortase [Pontibacterium granulatum]
MQGLLTLETLEGTVDRRFPFPLKTFCAAICIIFLTKGDLLTLCFDLNAITHQGEWWRLITGHLVHSNSSHLFWDLCAFAAVSCYLERHTPALLLPSWLAGLISVNLLLMSPLSELSYYCGLSGMLFAPLIVALFQFQKQIGGLIGYLPLLVTGAKLGRELISSKYFLVQSEWAPYPEAHLAGLMGGLLLMAAVTIRSRLGECGQR